MKYIPVNNCIDCLYCETLHRNTVEEPSGLKHTCTSAVYHCRLQRTKENTDIQLLMQFCPLPNLEDYVKGYAKKLEKEGKLNDD